MIARCMAVMAFSSLLMLMLSGCLVQGGAYAARDFQTDRWAYGGQLASRSALPLGDVFRLEAGGELEGHAEEAVGSVPTWGTQLGGAFALSQTVSLAPHFDLGAPIGWTSSVGGHYLGGTLELPIRLRAQAGRSQVNRNYRFLDDEGALVPFVRFRHYELTVHGVDQPRGDELAIGFAVRTELVTDLLAL